MTIHPDSFAKLAKATALLAYSTEPAWDDEFDQSLIDASRVLLQEGFYVEAVECAYAAASAHSRTDKEPVISNMRAVCREVFERGGFGDDDVAKQVLTKLTEGLAWHSRGTDISARWGRGLLNDWKRYTNALIADGRAGLIKEIADKAIVPHTSLPNTGLQRLGREVLRTIEQRSPAGVA